MKERNERIDVCEVVRDKGRYEVGGWEGILTRGVFRFGVEGYPLNDMNSLSNAELMLTMAHRRNIPEFRPSVLEHRLLGSNLSPIVLALEVQCRLNKLITTARHRTI